MRFLFTLALFAFFLSTGWAADWNQFRGPKGDGHADGAKLPITWSEKENVTWKTKVPGKAWASPVIEKDTIWLANATEDGKTLSITALDLATGKVKHEQVLFQPVKPQFCIAFNSYASCTPVVSDGKLYVHFGAHGTACVDTTTHKVLWDRTDLQCDHYRGPGSSPILHKGKLYLTFDGFDVQYVAALNAETGKTVWKTDKQIKFSNDNGDLHKAYGTPHIITVDGKEQLVVPAAESTQAFDPETGKEIWRVTTGGMNESCRPVYAHGMLYLTTGHTSGLMAVKPEGTGVLSNSNQVWKFTKEAPTRPSPIVVDNFLYMVSDKGIATALDAKTGAKIWQERLDGAFSASPIHAYGFLYCPGENGKTFVLGTGKVANITATNKLDDGCLASPAVSGNALILRTRTHVYKIEDHKAKQ